MGLGIRTPVTRREAGAGASGPQENTAGPPQPSTAGTSGVVARTATPSPKSPPGQALDAARTFIRRPERKRRSVDIMEAYSRQCDIYAAQSNDKLLQEVMRTFEDIPAKVKDYPQMRKDIKTFLETQSDKCLRTLFELSKRMKGLETAPPTAQPARTTTTPALPDLSEALIERLEKMEKSMETGLSGIVEKVSKNVRNLHIHIDNSGADIVDKLQEVGVRFDEVKASLDNVQVESTAFLEKRLSNVTGEVAAITEEIRESIRASATGPKTDTPRSYASVAAARPGYRPALHSVAVTFEGGLDTADEVLAKVKKAVDARETGLKINKVRKAKNQTVILGCDSEVELRKVKERIESRGEGLIVSHMKNKNPLVVLKDVFLDSEDDELVKAIYSQNKDTFRDLEEEELEMTIKYKKRTKNPKTAHVVVQVRPRVWQRMTEAGALYLDLQRVRVEDQSPLVQCTKCLAYGHGRKFCTAGADRCSHCGGPHLREKCEEFVSGMEPQCCNCLHSKLQKTDHNAFSAECPVRKKWDYLARTTTAYA